METSEQSENTTLNQLTLFAGGFLDKMSVLQVKERDLKEKDQRYGPNLVESFARFNQNGLLLKMFRGYIQLTMDNSLPKFLETYPRAGMMRNGMLFRQRPLARLTEEIGFSLWPTPNASDERVWISGFSGLRSRKVIPELGIKKGWINPKLSEWLMGFPINWTDLSHSETP